ncbi:MAG: hypothetical protein IPK26_25230 [Planctomycetes bacterium]|nr:hypothetical protein [Planctomycetota bacterium]
MPMAIDVVLPTEQEVTWPDLCPGCGERPCDNLLSVAHRRTSVAAWFWPILYLFGKRRAFEVPICSPCRRQQMRSRWLRFGAGVAIVVAVFWLIDPWLRNQIASRNLRRLTLLGIAVIALSPVIALYVCFPPAVDITVGKKTIAFEFARRDYADAFKAANRPRS